MSIRAHKITKIEYAKCTTFNLWHDEVFMDMLNVHICDKLNCDGSGTFDISRDLLEELKEEWQEIKSKHKKEEIERVEEIFKLIEEDFDEDGYVTYSAF